MECIWNEWQNCECINIRKKKKTKKLNGKCTFRSMNPIQTQLHHLISLHIYFFINQIHPKSKRFNVNSGSACVLNIQITRSGKLSQIANTSALVFCVFLFFCCFRIGMTTAFLIARVMWLFCKPKFFSLVWDSNDKDAECSWAKQLCQTTQ